jgi:DNA-cytosine methyltransferase
MKIIDLFAGIGTASLAADIVWGKENVEHEFCEINPYGQTILKKHFPNSHIHDDIRTYKPTGPCDILWGSPPCQAASSAGKRKGTADDRWLWPDYFRVLRESKARWCVAENVQGLLSLNGGSEYETLCASMEAEGYEVRAFLIPASAVGAPHRRNRIWLLGHLKNERGEGDKSGQGRFGISEQNKLGSDTERICVDKSLEQDNKNEEKNRIAEFPGGSSTGIGSGPHQSGQVGQSDNIQVPRPKMAFR